MDSFSIWFSYALVFLVVVLRFVQRNNNAATTAPNAKSISIKCVQGNTCASKETPVYHSSGAGGFDLRAAQDVTLQPNTFGFVNTFVRLEIPPGHAGFIKGRSSMAKKGIWCFEGLVDSDYRGDILVQLRNFNDDPYIIMKNDRIAQLVILEYVKANLNPVESSNQLEETERGAKGFGSTGVGSDDVEKQHVS